MRPLCVQAFADDAGPARRLADALGAPFGEIDLHRFPDGELLPRAPAPARTVIAYAALDHPNERLIALLLAADAWRRQAVARLVLVAPYLCYMRQDAVFAPGEPLSRDVICGLIGRAFDRVVTVDAHLHRTARLSDAFPGVEADNLSAAGPLAEALALRLPAAADGRPPLVAGPDTESAPWARAIAERLGADTLVFEKRRRGDREVRLFAPDLARAAGRVVALVDDVCSSGETLAGAARLLAGAGAAVVVVAVTHALHDAAAGARLQAAGVRAVVSSDSVRHPSNGAPLAQLLAHALRQEQTP